MQSAAKLRKTGPRAGTSISKKDTTKKKWSKGKQKEPLSLAVFYDKGTYDKLIKDVPAMKLITVATVSDRLKITGSMARMGIRHLAEKKLIRPCGEQHSAMLVYNGIRGEKDY